MNKQYDESVPGTNSLGDYVVTNNTVCLDQKGKLVPVMRGVAHVDSIVTDPATGKVSFVLAISPFLKVTPCMVRVASPVLHNKSICDTLTERGIIVENPSEAMRYLKESAMQASDLPPRELVKAPCWLADHTAFFTGTKLIMADGVDDKRFWLETKASSMRTSGEFDIWKQEVLPLIEANPVMLASCCIGLASLFLDRLGHSSSMFNFWGEKGMGKTLGAQAVASIYGNGIDPAQGARVANPPFISRFNGTLNGLEAVLSSQGPAPTLLDEVTEAHALVVSQSVYMLGGGQGKHRMTTSGAAAERGSWLTTIMLSAESSIADIAASSGKSLYGGQADRAVDIPINEVGMITAFGEHGSFNAATGHLKRICAQQYGTAGERLIEYCVNNREQIEQILAMAPDIEEQLLPENCGAGERRVVKRMAGAVVAGYIAVMADVFEEGTEDLILEAVKMVTALWWKSRASCLERIKILLENHEESICHGRPKLDRAVSAFIFDDLVVIPIEVFNREFDDDAQHVLNELAGLGALKTEQRGRHVHRFCSNRFRGYAIRAKKIWPDATLKAA